MKTNKITQLFIAFCLTLITLSANAQTSQVVYNNPEHTSGSLTLSAADCSSGWWYYDWVITVPVNTPIKVTTQLNYEAYLDVYTYSAGINQYAFSGDQPNTTTTRIITTNGSIYIYCEDWYGINPTSNVFTISFEVDSMSYSPTNDLHVPGNLSVISGLDVFGNTNIAGATNIQGNTRIFSKLGIGTSAYDSKLHVYNYNQDSRAIYLYSNKSSTTSLYGLYSSASNGTGNVYGIYSTVSGVSGKKWAGYFNGGDVEINNGVLKPNSDMIIGPANKQFIFHTQAWLPNNPPKLIIAPKLNDADWDWNKQIIFDHEGSILMSGGKLGVGAIQIPDSFKLAVAGKIIAEEVVVKLQSAWPDYVFHQDYRLKPLHEVEQFVKANKHLPGIPSAAQVEEKGLSMGEMQNKLLQKIEELTLYVIELQKTNDEQSKKIIELETRLK
jgi:hypothetical protein